MKITVEFYLSGHKSDDVYARYLYYHLSKMKHGKQSTVLTFDTESVTFDKIEKAVCVVTGRTPDEIQFKKRKREVVEARQLCHHLSKLYLKPKKSLSEIGFRFGRKDHATVLYSSKTVLALLETDINYKSKYQSLIYQFENGS